MVCLENDSLALLDPALDLLFYPTPKYDAEQLFKVHFMVESRKNHVCKTILYINSSNV